MNSEAQKLHAQAEHAREAGNFWDALKFVDEALLSYQKESDKSGFAEVLDSKVLIFRHLFEKTADRNFLILAKHLAEASVEIAEKSRDKTALAVPYFNLGKVYDQMGNFKAALDNYQKALTNLSSNPPENYNRPAILADFKIHLGLVELKTGDQTALARILSAVSGLEESDEDSYNKRVWLSGAYLHLAEILRKDSPEESEEFLQKAKEIIDNDPELKLRKDQLTRFCQKSKE